MVDILALQGHPPYLMMCVIGIGDRNGCTCDGPRASNLTVGWLGVMSHYLLCFSISEYLSNYGETKKCIIAKNYAKTLF